MLNLESLLSNILEMYTTLQDEVTPKPFEYGCEAIPAEGGQHVEVFDYIEELAWMELCDSVRHQIVPGFWKNFMLDLDNSTDDADQYLLFEKFATAVDELYNNYKMLTEFLQRLKLLSEKSGKVQWHKHNEAKLQEILCEALICRIPAHFNHVIDAFYNVSFKVFANVDRRTESKSVGTDIGVLNKSICNGCNCEVHKCYCYLMLSKIYKTNDELYKMQLLDRIAGQTMTAVVQEFIRIHIKDTCLGIFDKSHLNPLETWLDNVVISWLTRLFNHGELEIEANNYKTKSVIQSFKVKLTYFLYENFANSIIDQFFNIIIDFPDSIPALDDLKICFEKIDIRHQLISTIKKSLEARILHPGVNTMDILTGYVAAIKAIRHLDTTGIILEAVIEPIKEYLRKRSDTVRRVVTGLTEEGPTDLSEELAKCELLHSNVGSGLIDELSTWENWLPEPLTLDFTNRNPSVNVGRNADIISMVIDIYGSKELFMNEYRNLMGDRLLQQLEFIPEKEIRNLELLKLRFGESLLHSCEVMLKDVADSKRINAHIHSDASYRNNKTFDMSALILSAQFWPSFNKENLELPEEIDNEFKKFTTSYEAYKGNRTLNWRTVNGRVNISVEFGDRTFDMIVPPTQAVILYHFQHKSKWTVEELSTKMKITASTLRRRIHFWKVHGLIREVAADVFELLEEKVQKDPQFMQIQNVSALDDDEIESAMASASDQREEELQVFWSYIVGMLTNLDCLPIERIHQMLKLFASQGIGIEFSQDELKDFLQRKVREHKLIFSGGVYQLTK